MRKSIKCSLQSIMKNVITKGVTLLVLWYFLTLCFPSPNHCFQLMPLFSLGSESQPPPPPPLLTNESQTPKKLKGENWNTMLINRTYSLNSLWLSSSKRKAKETAQWFAERRKRNRSDWLGSVRGCIPFPFTLCIISASHLIGQWWQWQSSAPLLRQTLHCPRPFPY